MELDHDVIFHQGMCSMQWCEKNIKKTDNATIILDDLARDISADTAEIFAVGSHHLKMNVCLVVHNLFEKNIAFRNISLNSRYICIQKNPRDSSTITNFAKQFDPGNGQRMVNIYKDATERPFSYLFLDMDQYTPEQYRLRSNIFFEGDTPIELFERGS
jgi:hypothetical protein